MSKVIKSDIKDSIRERGKELARKYKDVVEQIKLFETFKNTIKLEMFDVMEMLDETKIDGVKKVQRVNVDTVSVAKLKKLFNEDFKNTEDNDIRHSNLIDNVMVRVDIERTVENLLYLNGLQEPLAKSVGDRLEDLQVSKYVDLEIGK